MVRVLYAQMVIRYENGATDNGLKTLKSSIQFDGERYRERNFNIHPKKEKNFFEFNKRPHTSPHI